MTTTRDALSIVIVDDEALARQGLLDAIARLGRANLGVAAVCANGVDALDVIREHQPDVLLLDIAMPVLDGFAMLERLEPETTPPAVIFVTAFDEYAVRAFEAEALDFLVKPIGEARLAAALGRAERRVREARAARAVVEHVELAPPEARYLSKLIVPERGGHLVIPTSEIDWIEGDTYYVRVHAHGRARLLRERLSRLEALLDPLEFVRTHRSALVRIGLIRDVRAESPYTHSAMLSTGVRVPVSRERLRMVQQALTRHGSNRR